MGFAMRKITDMSALRQIRNDDDLFGRYVDFVHLHRRDEQQKTP